MTDSGGSLRDEPAGLSDGSAMAGPFVAAPAGVAMSGQDVLLATKLHVPQPQPGFVPRRRLVDTLGEGLARGRVLVCAPAGFGKSSLLADWARGSGRPVAWLALDGGDSDPARFWRYTVAALDRVRPGLAGRMSPLPGLPPTGSFAGLVTALINELAADPSPDEALLVLDDYHLIDSRPVQESVGFLLENLPPGLRVVVSGRADPPLPLARMRARGQLAELRVADLRFTPEEAAALLGETAGPGLPAKAAETRVDRTEGWAAGLHLAGLSLRGHADAAGFVASFGGSHRFVLDYLADEVLDRQTEQVRAFVLETSVLERLSGELCDAVTGRAGSQAMLQDIERAGLFLMPLDEARSWWRYHHLFADLLRARLQAEQPGRAQALHRAAAAWSEDHDLADDAVRHALAAGTPPGRHSWSSGTSRRCSAAARERPCAAGFQHSRRRRYAIARGSTWPRHTAPPWASSWKHSRPSWMTPSTPLRSAAKNRMNDPAGRPVSVLANVPAGIAFLRATLARLRGDAVRAARYNRQALAQLGEDDWLMRSFVRWNEAAADWLGGRLSLAERGLTEVLAELLAADEAVRRVGAEPTEVLRAVEGGAEFFAGFLAMRVYYDLGEVQRAQGSLDAALTTYRQALDAAGESSQTAHTGLAHVGVAQVLYERNDLAAAFDHATRGVALCRQLAFTLPLAAGLVVVARIRQAHGDAAGAQEVYGRSRAGRAEPAGDQPFNPLPSQRARLLLGQGDVRMAAQWATAAGLGSDDEPITRKSRRSGAGPGAARPKRPRRGARAAAAATRRRGQPGPY